jgi:hypothetical protein
MPLYDRPVRELFREFIADRGIRPGQTFAKSDLAAWFRQKYPKVKPTTVQAQTITVTTNNPTRIHYNATARHDIFFQVGRNMLRVYDPLNDPPPIYTGEAHSTGDVAAVDVDSQELAEGNDDTSFDASEFAYESDLKNYLAANLNQIEPGLRLYDGDGASGVEFPVGGRYVDILAVDANDNLVVIELKVSRGYDRVVGQIARYMAWLEQSGLSGPGKRIRGMIIARTISEDLILACRRITDVSLFEYTLSVRVERIGTSASSE